MKNRPDDEQNALRELMALLLRHTVVLVRADDAKEGEAVRGSGVVVPWNGGLRVVSARHIFEKGEWCVEAGDASRGTDAPAITEGTIWSVPTDKRRTLLLRLRPDPAAMTAVTEDIAWAFLDFDRDTLRAEPDARFATLPIYSGPIDVEARPDELYAFAAVNRDEHHPHLNVVRREVSYEAYMTSTPAEAEVRFALARDHQGDPFYRGASGAPIADRSGAIVAVLVGAGTRPNELCAASLGRFIRAMTAIEQNS